MDDQGERIARLEEQVRGLRSDVRGLAAKVANVHDTIQQARGARWAIVSMAMVGGFLAGLLAKLQNLIGGS